jgi:hypothetical protein
MIKTSFDLFGEERGVQRTENFTIAAMSAKSTDVKYHDRESTTAAAGYLSYRHNRPFLLSSTQSLRHFTGSEHLHGITKKMKKNRFLLQREESLMLMDATETGLRLSRG